MRTSAIGAGLRLVLLLLLIPIVVLILMGKSAPAASASGLEGRWRGVIVREGAETVFLLDLDRHDGKWHGSFGFPEQRVLEYPLDRVDFVPPDVTLAGPGGGFTLEGTLSGDALSGVFKDEGGTASFRLERSREEAPYTREDVRFANGEATLQGSLYVPKGPGPYPALIFLHGAGPEIRWGASRFFSDYLARRGIAALIYDKRGTGESTGDWRRSDFNALAQDALSAVRLLRTRSRIDPKRIGIYGHSQGGTIAPLIASQSRDVAFVVSAAGGAVPMWQGEIHSLRTQVRAEGAEGESLARADAFIDRMVAVARSGKGWRELNAEWQAAHQRGEPWAELLRPPPEDSYFWSFYPGIAEYDAAEYWRKVNVPVLVVQAGEDIYVSRERSIAAIDAALREAGHRDFTIVVLPGAPHNLVLQPGANRSLKWPQLYPGYADLLVGWIEYRMGSRRGLGRGGNAGRSDR